MGFYEVIRDGGVWWTLDDPRSPGHEIALPSGSHFKIRTGGRESNAYVDGHIETGLWVLDGGQHAGGYPTADAAVRAVHNGTSLNAWLYVVILHNGTWLVADEVRRLSATQIDEWQAIHLKWLVGEVKKRPEAKGVSNERIHTFAAKRAAANAQEESDFTRLPVA